MTISQNNNFKSVEIISNEVAMKYYSSANSTAHMYSRKDRFNQAIILNNNSKIDNGFFVDKGHDNGKEVHIVTTSGCIFIYNARTSKLVTVLIARANQVKRLYNHCGQFAPRGILNNCYQHSKVALNTI